jgi:hypothetical protein
LADSLTVLLWMMLFIMVDLYHTKPIVIRNTQHLA